MEGSTNSGKAPGGDDGWTLGSCPAIARVLAPGATLDIAEDEVSFVRSSGEITLLMFPCSSVSVFAEGSCFHSPSCNQNMKISIPSCLEWPSLDSAYNHKLVENFLVFQRNCCLVDVAGSRFRERD